jgi:hypothetical protein
MLTPRRLSAGRHDGRALYRPTAGSGSATTTSTARSPALTRSPCPTAVWRSVGGGALRGRLGVGQRGRSNAGERGSRNRSGIRPARCPCSPWRSTGSPFSPPTRSSSSAQSGPPHGCVSPVCRSVSCGRSYAGRRAGWGRAAGRAATCWGRWAQLPRLGDGVLAVEKQRPGPPANRAPVWLTTPRPSTVTTTFGREQVRSPSKCPSPWAGWFLRQDPSPHVGPLPCPRHAQPLPPTDCPGLAEPAWNRD